MKTLDIFNNNNGNCISFDECMTIDGKWIQEFETYFIDNIVKLNYESLNYDYFLFQDDSGNHTLLRNKK